MSPIAKILLGFGAVVAGLAVFGKSPGESAAVGDVVDVPLDKLAAGLPELLTRLRQEQPKLKAFAIRVDAADKDTLSGPIVEMVLAPNDAHLALTGLAGGVGPIVVNRKDVTSVRKAKA